MEASELYGQLEAAKHAREAERHAAQVALPCLLAGDATWIALKRAVDDIVSFAPKDHDVLVRVDDVSVFEARFIEPHTFLFHGIDSEGHQTRIIIHFSQLSARVVYLPKKGPSRVVTGFSKDLS